MMLLICTALGANLGWLGQLASPGPVAFEIGPIPFRWYGLLITAALVIGITLAQPLAQGRGVDPEKIDELAIWLVLGQAIGRWGNFFNSEAFGRPTDLPWKLYIPPAQRPPGLADVAYYHPTFLYESLWNLGVFALVLGLFVWGLRHPGRLKVGTIFLVYFATYSLGRLWIEGLRLDSLMLGPLKMAQVISLGGIVFGVAGLVWLYGLGRRLSNRRP